MRLKKAQFHTFEFTPDVTALQYGERVERWRKGAASYPAQILFKGTKADRIAAIDAFHVAIERDMIYKTPGILTWGNSYISCYLRSSGTYPSDANDTETFNDVEIYCPSSAWITEQHIVIDPVEQTQVLRPTDIQYDPTYGYPYSYMQLQGTSKNIYVDHFAPCDFKAVLYGPVSGVDIAIGSRLLKVDRAVPAGGHMVIDTRDSVDVDRHCYLVTAGGVQNCFNYRDPESSLLGRIDPGFNRVVYDRTTRLELTVFRERSEPEWN
jgi:hypothetical protein